MYILMANGVMYLTPISDQRALRLVRPLVIPTALLDFSLCSHKDYDYKGGLVSSLNR